MIKAKNLNGFFLFLLMIFSISNASTLTFEGQNWFTENWTENGINWTLGVASDIRGYTAHSGSLHLFVQRSNDYLKADHFITVNSLYIYIDDIDDDNSYVDFIGYDDNNNLIKTQRYTPPSFSFDYEFVNLSGFTNIAKLEIKFDGTVNPYIDDIDYTDNGPLPVELTHFEGTATEEGILLEWETATEVNNYGFEIEREKGGSGDWEMIGFVEGHGTTNSPKQYSFTDPLNFTLNPNLTFINYRLKQIDNDGTFEYSKVITVDLTNITSVDYEIEYEFALEQNYPNPFNPTTTIKFTIPSNMKSQAVNTKLIVFNALGQVVGTLLNETLSAGIHEVVFDGTDLSSGVYIYKLMHGKYTDTRKLLLIK